MKCTNCGGDVVPSTYNLHPHVAPWTCHNCHRAWWTAELTPQAKALWRASHKDWGMSNEQDIIHVQVAKERKDAVMRGVCIRTDQLTLLQRENLQDVLVRDITPDFKKVVQDEVARRG